MRPLSRLSRGFTLLELMFVVLIISVLCSIVFRKAKEGGTQGNLGAIRSAIQTYYADQASTFPSSLSALTAGGQYLGAFPPAVLVGYHQDSNSIREGSAASVINDAGGWAYDNDSSDADFGKLWVNCTHTDTKGSVWTAY
ncbi:MAG: type II secretion system protein [Elusimicrobia bacterium]|nr:type II secretion system protein [Elusimicrobiota bacterium]